MGLNIKFYDDKHKEGELTSVGYIPVDTKVRKDSKRLASSGAVAEVEEKVDTAAEALQEQIDDIAEKAGSGYIPKGEADVATLNGLSGQENGWLYTLTDAGTLTDGSLAVVAGDTVAWDDGNSVWYKALNYAPMQYGTNEVHNLATTATEADFVSSNFLALDGSEWTKKLPANIVFENLGDVYGDLGKTTLESCSDEGFYRLGAANFSHITDLPSGISATFTLFVKRLDIAGRYNQQIIKCNDGKVYWRNAAIPGQGGTTSNWHELAVFEKGVEEGYFKTFGDIYVDLGYTSFAECLEDGVYRCGSANYASITDKPDTLTATCTLYVKRLDLDNKYVQQIIIANNGQIYWRNCARPNSGGTTSAWKNITQNFLTRWAAMGDSITEGVYSTGNGYQTAVTAKNYPYYVSMINGWNYTNYGKGGAGYVRHAPSDSKNAMQKANEINFANFDIVTLAYGVNDWHYAQPIGSLETSTDGDGTMVGNMKATIKKILNDNPLIKIVVILPHNCSRYGGGDYDTNWGYGHGDATTSGTLKSVIDKEIEVCEYFGIQYIDNVHNGIVNRENINDFMLDGIHPCLDGYLPMAKYIAKQIQFS